MDTTQDQITENYPLIHNEIGSDQLPPEAWEIDSYPFQSLVETTYDMSCYSCGGTGWYLYYYSEPCLACEYNALWSLVCDN